MPPSAFKRFAMGQQNQEPVSDRPVTRDRVIEAIREYLDSTSADHFTTLDIAKHMQCSEYQVRTAFTWLTRYEVIETVPGVRSKRYLGQAADPTKRRHAHSYYASVYQLKVESAAAPPDFNALMAVFCR